MLVQGLQGEGSIVLVESHHTPSELKLTKQTYGVAFTKLIKKVKKLEKTFKTSQARRRAKIVILDDDMVLEDSSKQGRMIEDIDQDAGVILVTPTEVKSQDDQPEDQLGVLSAAKILADATRVHTYGRRRRAVSTSRSGVSTASKIISTAEETISTAGVSMPVSTGGMVQENTSSPRATKDKGKTSESIYAGVYERMVNMKIRQGAIKRMFYRQSYHWDSDGILSNTHLSHHRGSSSKMMTNSVEMTQFDTFSGALVSI
nr:hypothetical protein [Tanacetum cinerariifolium]